MPRALSVLCLISSSLLPSRASACQCESSFSTCREVVASDLVFIGTVQSIEPIFMNRWNMKDQSSVRSLIDAYTDAQQRPSASALARLKDTYLKIFSSLEPNEKRQLEAAETVQDVGSLFDFALDRGLRARFLVKALFKYEDDDDAAQNAGAKDDKAKDDDDRKDDHGKSVPDFFDVWTTFGDCGDDFQIGETYLVYANNDEDGNYFFTGSCTRTRRVSDAGDDLAYLFFYKDQPAESARLEGFTTTERQDFDVLHDPETVKSPVAGIIVKLTSERLKRYAQTDAHGRFIFDGLPEGDYQMSAFANGYPLKEQLLAGPKPIHLKEKSCARQILLLPKKDGN
jgi:hypothetical protein